jgi:hypothetical protein
MASIRFIPFSNFGCKGTALLPTGKGEEAILGKEIDFLLRNVTFSTYFTKQLKVKTYIFVAKWKFLSISCRVYYRISAQVPKLVRTFAADL